MKDIEISNKSIKKPIIEIIKDMGLDNTNSYIYGDYKAKVKVNNNLSNSKLILVTAMSPTPYGEGKTTVSIGLNDALCRLNKKSCII